MTPQRPPSTVIGTPTVARTPIARTASAAAPDAVEKSSIRAGRPVSNTRVVTCRPPSGVPRPAAPTHACAAPLGRQAADHVRGENGDHQLRHGVRVGDRQSEQRRGDEEVEHQRRQDATMSAQANPHPAAMRRTARTYSEARASTGTTAFSPTTTVRTATSARPSANPFAACAAPREAAGDPGRSPARCFGLTSNPPPTGSREPKPLPRGPSAPQPR